FLVYRIHVNPLFLAAKENDVSSIKKLIKCPSTDIYEKGALGETVLHIASLFDSLEAAVALIEAAPDLINKPIISDFSEGETALHIAVMNENINLVQELIRRGADVVTPRATGECLPKRRRNLVYFGEHILTFAACTGNEKIVRLLIDNGADIRAQDQQGNTVLHVLVFQPNKLRSCQIYDLIMSYDMEEDSRMSLDIIRNNKGLTPLKLAAAEGNSMAYKILEITPVKQLIKLKWMKYARHYFRFLMLVYILYITIFTLCCIFRPLRLRPDNATDPRDVLLYVKKSVQESYVTYNDHLRLIGEMISVIGAVVVLLVEIMISDMLRFIWLMSFTLIGFSTALWMPYMTQDPAADDHFSDFSTTFFLQFELSLGLLNLPLNFTVWTPNIVKVLHTALTVFAFLVIMFLLVAMLGDTQTRVAEERNEIWRAQVVATIIMLERKLPRWMWTRIGICGKEYGLKNKWYLSIHQNLLFLAAQKNDVASIKKLMKCPTIDIFEKGTLGETALHIAALFNNVEAAVALIEVAPDLINEPIVSDFYKGETALHIAVLNENMSLVQELIHRGADVFSPRATGECLRKKRRNLVYFGEHILSFAACTGNEEIVRFLIENGADIRAQDRHGNTVLHILIFQTNKISSCHIYDLIMAYDMKENSRIPLDLIQNNKGLTPFKLAAAEGNLEARTILEIAPVKQLTKLKWMKYAKHYFRLLMLVYILYIIIFTLCCIFRPLKLRPDNATDPRDVLLYVKKDVQKERRRGYASSRPHGGNRPGGYGNHRKGAWKLNPTGARGHHQGVPKCLRSPDPQLFRHTRSITYSCLLLILFMLRITNSKGEMEIMAYALVLGWCNVLFFARGFEMLGPYVVMVHKIMFSDMLRFIWLMTFTVIGFTAALWMAYMTQDPSADPQFGDFPTTFFVEFELSLGLLDIPLNYSVWTPNIVKVLHAALTIFAFLLIMNLLIAMLGDTQTRVAEERDEIWRAQVVATILMLERRLPRWMWTRFGICGKQYGLESKWYLRINESPLLFAAKENDVTSIKNLVNSPSVDIFERGTFFNKYPFSILYIGVSVKTGFIQSSLGAVGETALHVAAFFDNLEAAVALMDAAPALINEPMNSDLYAGQTALHIAVVNQNINLLKMLICRGADVVTPRVTGSYFQKNIQNLVYFGEHILSFSASVGNEEIVKLLIEEGANIHAQDSLGNTVLHILVFQPNKSTSCKIFDLIMSYDKPNAGQLPLDFIQNHKGLTPFKMAAAEGNLVMFQHILNKRRVFQWCYGPLSSYLYDLTEIDSWADESSILELIVCSEKREIIFSDLLCFIWLMSFTLIGFSTALWMPYMTQDPSQDPQFGDFPTLFFVEFELSLGLLDIPMNYSVWTPSIVKILHVALTVFTFLLMMNLLIAMMADTQWRVAQERDELWRAQVVATTVMLERRIPRCMWPRLGIWGGDYGLDKKWYFRVEDRNDNAAQKLRRYAEAFQYGMTRENSDKKVGDTGESQFRSQLPTPSVSDNFDPNRKSLLGWKIIQRNTLGSDFGEEVEDREEEVYHV
ncbi:TRPV6 protein, partial [Polypterus senegalus]